MIFNSIRWRVQIWHGLILVVVLTGFGFTAYHVARDNQLRRIDAELDQRMMVLFRPEPRGHGPGRRPGEAPGGPHDDGPGGPLESGSDNRSDPPFERRHDQFPNNRGPDFSNFLNRIRSAVEQAGATDSSQTNGLYYVLWQHDGSVLARSPGAPEAVPVPEPRPPFRPDQSSATNAEPAPPPGPPSPSLARTRGEFRELFRFLPHNECVLVGRSMAADLAAMQRLALWLAMAGSAVLLLGLVGGGWLASRAIRPIEDISATATKIAAGDLSQRINAADTESELGRLAAVLNSTFARLEAAFEHQARFTSDASHELRTPVSVILSQTQTALSRDRSTVEYREALESCQRAAQRMRRLAESLLELARLDAGQEPIKREPFDLARVARDCLELVRPLANERGLKMLLEVSACPCRGDAERVGQVVTNLLTNAIQFNRDGGEIKLTTRSENGAVLLTVSDTGLGIPPEDLPHVFERFYRVDKSRSRGHTGLGLAICKAIVDAHGGAIEVSSQPGVGSTFTVKLPIA